MFIILNHFAFQEAFWEVSLAKQILNTEQPFFFYEVAFTTFWAWLLCLLIDVGLSDWIAFSGQIWGRSMQPERKRGYFHISDKSSIHQIDVKLS